MRLPLGYTNLLKIPPVVHFKRSVSSKMTKFDVNAPSIKLNETEAKISSLLKDYVQSQNQFITDESKKLELRITGGWVRDKLLGNESNDLDIAINTQTGEEFADGLRGFLNDNFEKYGLAPSSIHKIEKNPEKSKHLETATTKLYGLDIDFVNLRNEEYTADSRIPVIKFGSPQEDALRRDATLNALFYNIQKDVVEDLTGSGLKDLAGGVLKTPLAPLQTFLDDPLRVLRLIRFASRFHFKIQEEAIEAMKEDRIKEALLYKISRERVGVEIEKTLCGPNPAYGLQLLSETGLYSAVFNFGCLQDAVLELNDASLIKKLFKAVEEGALPSVQFVQSTNFSSSSIHNVVSHILTDKLLKRLFWMAMILRPWGNITVASNPKKQALKVSAVELIIREGLKHSKSDAHIIAQILTTSKQYQDVVNRASEAKRSEVGLLLKQYEGNFDLSLVINLFDEAIAAGSFEAAIRKYEQFHALVHREGLQNAHLLKPIVDGKTLSKELDKKPGPWMAKIMETILIWQLDNPLLGKSECIDYVKTSL